MKRTGIPHLALIFCCCLALSVAACGQRGPLFIPEPEEQVESSENVPDAEDEDKKEDTEINEPTPET